MPRRRRPTGAVVAAWRALLAAHAVLLPCLDEELRRAHDLPLEWYDVLLQLADAGGRLTMGDLAATLLIVPSNCTRRVAKMTEAGLVLRSRDADDSRVVHVTLTARGRSLQRRAAATHLRGIQHHVGRFLDDATAAAMTQALHATTVSARTR